MAKLPTTKRKRCKFQARLVAALCAAVTIPSHAADKVPRDLVFGARQDAAPLSSQVDDSWRGYTIDLCRHIYARYTKDYAAQQPGTSSETSAAEIDNLKFVVVPAVERMDQLINGDIDVLCGATTVTIRRMSQVDFTLLTFASGAGIMKRKGTDSSVLSNPGKNPKASPTITYVGCTENMSFVDCTTTQHWISKRFGGSIERLPKKTHQKAFQALADEQADFYVGDRVILAEMLKHLKDADRFQLAPGFLTFEPYAIAIRKGNEGLLSAANAALAELYRDPEAINEFYHRYFDTKQSKLLEAMYVLQAIPE